MEKLGHAPTCTCSFWHTWRILSEAEDAPSNTARLVAPGRAVVNGDVTAVSLAEHRSFDMGGPKLADAWRWFPRRDQSALGDVETAAIALRKTEHHGDHVVPRRVGDFLSERTVVA